MSEREGTVVIVGATSSIARELSRRMVWRGKRTLLAARDAAELSRCSADLRIRSGRDVEELEWPEEPGGSVELARRIISRLRPGPIFLAMCVGYLGDQALADVDPAERARIRQANLEIPVEVIEELLPAMTKQGGSILALSSVAGDRVRPSNALYGAAKAGLNAYLEALRLRTRRSSLRIVTAKLGPVATRMTFGMGRLPLMISPSRAAELIDKRLDRAEVIYVPSVWAPIMAAIRLIPEPIFRRMTF